MVFFDQTDSQNIQIVSPKYRTVDWIVKAAEELLTEMCATIPPAVGAEGLTAYLTRQACSRGPAILHSPENVDPVYRRLWGWDDYSELTSFVSPVAKLQANRPPAVHASGYANRDLIASILTNTTSTRLKRVTVCLRIQIVFPQNFPRRKNLQNKQMHLQSASHGPVIFS